MASNPAPNHQYVTLALRTEVVREIEVRAEAEGVNRHRYLVGVVMEHLKKSQLKSPREEAKAGIGF